MATYNTSDLRKGLKVLIDGDPFLILECNFVKPGKGQAIYRLRLKNLIRGTTLERTYRSGDDLEAADVREDQLQYLYRDGENFVFMHPETFDQPSLTGEQVGDTAQWLKDGLICNVTFWNDKPIAISPPNHMVLKVEHTEPGARGNTATNVTKKAKLETGAEVNVPIFIETGEMIKVDTRTNEYIERVRADK